MAIFCIVLGVIELVAGIVCFIDSFIINPDYWAPAQVCIITAIILFYIGRMGLNKADKKDYDEKISKLEKEILFLKKELKGDESRDSKPKAEVMLLKDMKTKDGKTIKQGTKGTIISITNNLYTIETGDEDDIYRVYCYKDDFSVLKNIYNVFSICIYRYLKR